MAGEVLANGRSDSIGRLSQVVNKYIGEDRKNLKRVSMRRRKAAILLFMRPTRCSASKRVKDSHDRYANIEVSYSSSAWRPTAASPFSTNMKARSTRLPAKNPIHRAVPVSRAAQRAEIWRRYSRNERRRLAGYRAARAAIRRRRQYRNIALNAAFIAAEAGHPVRMSHLLQAAKSECQKLEKPVNESEIGGWR
jgi:hypothetical protein